MEGVVATSPALRHAQDNPQPQLINNPSNSRSYIGGLIGVAVNTFTNYGQHRQSEAASDSETEAPDTPPPPASTPQFLERSQRKRHDGSYKDSRAIFAKIGSVDTADKVLFEMCVIYASSGNQVLRNEFYTNLLTEPFFHTPGQDFIVLGDFNYHHHMRLSAPVAWKDWIHQHTINTLSPLNTLPIHTFNNHRSQTTIDYIFMSLDLADRVTGPFSHLNLEALATGPGVWRLNTSILRDKEYTKQIATSIQQDLQHLHHLPPHMVWEELKAALMKELQHATKEKVKEREDISETVSTPRDLCDVGRAFYQRLYTPDPIDDNAVDFLLFKLPEQAVLSAEDQ
ncbi:hypothetical protein BGZ47_000430, partial [Haplosporangium gracile]